VSPTPAECSGCGRPGKPYTYRGEEFDGLCAFGRERLCPSCRDATLEDGQAHADKNAPVDVLSASRCARDQPTHQKGGRGRWRLG
jgi:hypothetical protein